MAIYWYQKRDIRKSFDVSVHFENPACSGIDDGQVKMCHPPEIGAIDHYNQIYVNHQVIMKYSIFNNEKPIFNLILQEPMSPIVEEYDINLTSDSDTAQLIY